MRALRHTLLLAGFCCLLALSAQASGNDLAMSHEAVSHETVQGVPAEVATLADRAAACRHWSNTEITDQSDDALVEGELTHLKCSALPNDLAALQRKYADSEPAQKAIQAVRAQGF
jgi:hypothetical protein